MGHGIGKVSDLFAGRTEFFDPFGIGGVASLALVAFAEFVCALAVVLGYKVRWAAMPVIASMTVAVLLFHGDDGFADRELALLYAGSFVTLMLTGGGKFSADELLGKRTVRR